MVGRIFAFPVLSFLNMVVSSSNLRPFVPTASLSPPNSVSIDVATPWDDEIFDLESLGNQTFVFVLTSHHEYFYEEELFRIMRNAENQVYLLGLSAIGAIATTICLAIKLTQ